MKIKLIIQNVSSDLSIREKLTICKHYSYVFDTHILHFYSIIDFKETHHYLRKKIKTKLYLLFK